MRDEHAARPWRHALSILLLPFTVVLVVPAILLDWSAPFDTHWPTASLQSWLGRGAGVLIFLAGLALFAWCATLFGRVGRGTLAPWDPTRRLVAVGPYRYVRNPMISGVAAMLAGEALYYGSTVIAGWSALFVVINHAYFLLAEEPGLERRFGAAYLRYREAVPRWLPRLRNRRPADASHDY